MRNLRVNPKHITDGQAMNLIFDACRGNDDRDNYQTESFDVGFKQYGGNEHLCEVKAKDGSWVATAIVDQFDA